MPVIALPILIQSLLAHERAMANVLARRGPAVAVESGQ